MHLPKGTQLNYVNNLSMFSDFSLNTFIEFIQPCKPINCLTVQFYLHNKTSSFFQENILGSKKQIKNCLILKLSSSQNIESMHPKLQRKCNVKKLKLQCGATGITTNCVKIAMDKILTKSKLNWPKARNNSSSTSWKEKAEPAKQLRLFSKDGTS